MPFMPTAPTARDLIQALDRQADPAQARILQSFFKTAPGQYGHGDVFLGLKTPTLRATLRPFHDMLPKEAAKLVRSRVHEHRAAGLSLWVRAFERGDEATRREVFAVYLRHTRHINNWDLVDLSAPQIVGGSLEPADTTFLESLAESPLLWERRIAILATLAYIRQGIFEPTVHLCELLLQDPHDLMHKACGWMLREVGKRDRKALSRFLNQHAATMPRTMLRYAIEHYPTAERKSYLAARSLAAR